MSVKQEKNCKLNRYCNECLQYPEIEEKNFCFHSDHWLNDEFGSMIKVLLKYEDKTRG